MNLGVGTVGASSQQAVTLCLLSRPFCLLPVYRMQSSETQVLGILFKACLPQPLTALLSHVTSWLAYRSDKVVISVVASLSQQKTGVPNYVCSGFLSRGQDRGRQLQLWL